MGAARRSWREVGGMVIWEWGVVHEVQQLSWITVSPVYWKTWRLTPSLLQAERNLSSEVQMPVVTEGLPLGWVLSPSDHPVPVFSYLFYCSKYLGVSLGDTGWIWFYIISVNSRLRVWLYIVSVNSQVHLTPKFPLRQHGGNIFLWGMGCPSWLVEAWSQAYAVNREGEREGREVHANGQCRW